VTGQRRGRAHHRGASQGQKAHAGRRADALQPRYAAIDLGTNNCRLLVAERTAEGFQVVDAFSRIVRLGEGLSREGILSEAAMGRALGALRVCADKLRRHHLVQVRAVATEACRQARNGQEFRRRVKRETGIDLEIIAQDEEARLALTGCAPLLQPDIPNALVFDIGGGSTEIIRLQETATPGRGDHEETRNLGIAAWHSMPVGVVGLAERHGEITLRDRGYEHMVEEVGDKLATAARRCDTVEISANGPMQMIGTSGTVTTLAGVYQHLPRYDRRLVDGCFMSFDALLTVSRRVAAMSYRERLAHPCIGRHRADLVVAGCAILEAICRIWPVGCLRVADRGLREGMLLQMMGHVGQNGFGVSTAGQTPAGQTPAGQTPCEGEGERLGTDRRTA
jgi:exopolyphosphatase/guanosine-5'-triphosphate,3'-diphosphate pyrophosphatase